MPNIRQRQDICKRLAGMFPIAQRVNHRDGRKRRQFFKIDVPENARDNTIHPQGEISRQVRNRFAFAQLTFLRAQEDRPCPELPDCNLECDSGSKRRLFENQRYVFSCKRLIADRTLNRRRCQQVCKLLGS